MKNRVMKILMILVIVTSVLGVIGFSYAYFSTEVKGESKNIVLETGDLKLRYTDDSSMSLNDALPGDSIVRTFKVENIGSKKVSYNILWNNLINTINNYDLQIDMKCKSYNSNTLEESGTCDSFYKAIPYSETSTSKSIKKDIEIDTNITQEYTVTITFKNRSYNQNDNLNKKFTGKIDLEEYIDPSPDPIYCTFDGELTQGAEYVNGQYTYRYKQQGDYSSGWQDITSDGWGVQLTDKDSTDAVTSKVCTYINNKPIVSMTMMFNGSQATSIDLSNFNTSNVTNMKSMFDGTKATTIDVSKFDTSNVINMSYMFNGSQATTLDLSNFDTSNVTSMQSMFMNSQATTLDLSNFDTSNVTDMSYMFYKIQVTTLDVSNFDTSNVVNMSKMFSWSQATTLDLSNFDTSNVTDMSEMFYINQATILDLSSFDTSKVTDMHYMFSNSTNLKTIYASNKFNTDAVTSSTEMFYD
ncbi:MAG: BspA family leucine-rich repeat surface protein, partial [Clostridium sp.]|nr:BspA family leucine-rich repeat surface protein [Clostridium sp.]